MLVVTGMCGCNESDGFRFSLTNAQVDKNIVSVSFSYSGGLESNDGVVMILTTQSGEVFRTPLEAFKGEGMGVLHSEIVRPNVDMNEISTGSQIYFAQAGIPISDVLVTSGQSSAIPGMMDQTDPSASPDTQMTADSSANPSVATATTNPADGSPFPSNFNSPPLETQTPTPNGLMPIPADLAIPVGTPLKAEYGGEWIPVEVLAAKSDGKLYIHWVGYSNGFDEDMDRQELRVDKDTLRLPKENPEEAKRKFSTGKTAAITDETKLEIGQVVEFDFGGKTYRGKITGFIGPAVKIQRDDGFPMTQLRSRLRIPSAESK